MIDIDKARAAFAATPLLRSCWVGKESPDQPSKLCAYSALIAFAGVQPDLISKVVTTVGSGRFRALFGDTILWATYGIPGHIASAIPSLFDSFREVESGADAVLRLFQDYNTAFSPRERENISPAGFTTDMVEYKFPPASMSILATHFALSEK